MNTITWMKQYIKIKCAMNGYKIPKDQAESELITSFYRTICESCEKHKDNYKGCGKCELLQYMYAGESKITYVKKMI